ncbi:MAG: signal peptidase I [Bacillus sp. (in: firmicutes)]
MKEVTTREVWSWVKAILLAVALVVICRTYIFTVVNVKGVSMEPTFETKDRLAVSKLSGIDRLDVIVFHAPYEESHYVKRVIGLPGDDIEVKNETLYINGQEVEEPYVNRMSESQIVTGDFTLSELTGETEVPAGKLFVMGDNRRNSNDSRAFGFIDEESVMGEVKLRFFPFNKFGLVNN